ncbi:PA14 domain-containing protein [Alkalilimnicola ehrlichii]|nr:PA14 domain-containing protein [Alkalilimnicola ehrlichii]
MSEAPFSVRWTGRLRTPHEHGTQIYSFYVVSDTAVRLWVGEELLLDGRGAREAQHTLQGGTNTPYA